MIPTQLWIVLFFIAGVIFAYMLFFADSGERAIVQGMLMGSVAAVITVLLLLLNGLDNPFHAGWAAWNRSRWSARCGSSTRRSARSDDRCSSRATRSGRRARDERRRRAQLGRAQLGGARARPFCSPSRPSRPRGAATRRPGGTASSRRRPLAQTRCGSTRRRPPAWRTARPRSTSRRSRSGSMRTPRSRPSSRTSTSSASEGVQARGRRLGRDQAAQEPEGAPDPVRDAPVQARGPRRGRPARRARPRYSPRRLAGTSSARRTTCSASSSLPRPCSSRA